MTDQQVPVAKPPRKPKGWKANPKTPEQRRAYKARQAMLIEADKGAVSLQQAKGRGRPSTYKPEYADVVVANAERGHSLTAIAHLIGVDPSQLTDWQGQHPEFRKAVARAKSMRLFGFEEQLIDICKNGGDSSRLGAVKFAMTNVSPEDWKERFEPSNVNVTMNIAALLGDVVKSIDAEPVKALPKRGEDEGEG